MNVLQVGAGMIPIPPPDYGAVEKHIWNLAKALEADGHRLSIVNDVFGERSVDEYRFALWASKRARAVEHDVVHLHTPGVALLFSLMGPRDFVFTTHSRHWSTRDGLGEEIGYALEKRAVRKARQVIAVSPMVKDAIRKELGHAAAAKVTVIPNGVDVGLYKPATAKRTGRRVVGLGEIAPHKKWDQAAAAIRGLDAELVLVGPIRDAAYASEVEDSAPGQVRLLGPVGERELVDALATADIQVHPSVSESFGMAAVEGMACGLPVVGSDLLGDLVKEGENGHVIPVDLGDEERVARLRQAITGLLGDPDARERMGARSREIAVAQYSWQSVAKRVADVYALVAES